MGQDHPRRKRSSASNPAIRGAWSTGVGTTGRCPSRRLVRGHRCEQGWTGPGAGESVGGCSTGWRSRLRWNWKARRAPGALRRRGLGRVLIPVVFLCGRWAEPKDWTKVTAPHRPPATPAARARLRYHPNTARRNTANTSQMFMRSSAAPGPPTTCCVASPCPLNHPACGRRARAQQQPDPHPQEGALFLCLSPLRLASQSMGVSRRAGGSTAAAGRSYSGSGTRTSRA